MSIFNFQSVQTLEILKEDKPHIDVHDGQLVLTAERGSEKIMITAPLNSVLPITSKTVVRSARRRRQQHKMKGVSLPSSDPRVGERSRQAKLTESDVREMRALVADADYRKEFKSLHEMYHAIGKVYKVHFTTVYNIVNNHSWKHVD